LTPAPGGAGLPQERAQPGLVALLLSLAENPEKFGYYFDLPHDCYPLVMFGLKYQHMFLAGAFWVSKSNKEKYSLLHMYALYCRAKVHL
jgi:hypothetical protein